MPASLLNTDMAVTNEDVIFRSSHSDRAAKCNTRINRINPNAKVHRKHLKGMF